LRHLDRDDQAVARGFYLSGWSGTQPYTFDRIIRGHRHIEAVCISVVGNTQPSRICEYVRRANADGAGGDGLLQRFGLMVWPDETISWRNVDEYPDSEARETAWRTFMRSGKLTQADVFALGAGIDAFDIIPSFRFDTDAQAEFIDWRSDLERKVRNGGLSPVMEGHIAKYRKLVPALALINHLADATEGGSVGISALRKAIAFADYVETHARRVYGAGSQVELVAGKAILVKIRNGSLPEMGFTARDIMLKGWASLTETEHVKAGLDLLADLDHLIANRSAPSRFGGRPSTTYTVNPRTLEK
jgi:putative DNA primase/helicase